MATLQSSPVAQSELKAKTAQDYLGSRSREFSFIKFS